MSTETGRKKMRLYKEQIEVLKSKLKTLSSTAKIYLFGSRVDDTAKGGDIDLLVISDELTKKDLRLLRVEFFKYFGEQKLDIVLDNGEFKNPFVKHIFQKAILL
jgi:predicted nucleotidyltransferase